MPALLEALLDLLYPPRCAACGEPSGPALGPFCATCVLGIDDVPPGCRRCGEPGPVAGPDGRCGACLASPPAFDEVRCGGLFGGPLADAIHALKYGGRPAVARPLGGWLSARVALPAGALVVPIPLSACRRRERGHDQAAALAVHLARSAGRPCVRAALRRIRATPPQVGRGRAERARNVAGSFAADARRVAGREVVLVDDVVTTGATADAAAEALKAAGASRVVVVALARAG